MANEIELKFSVESKHIQLLRRYLARRFNGNKPTNRKLVTIYYDTPNLALLNTGISLRIRRISGDWIQSIKAAGSAIAGLHQRMEWEANIKSDQPDFSKILDAELAKVFSNLDIRNTIKPIFKTVILRSEYQIILENGDHIELAIDKGHLVVNEVQEPISEIELELKNGHVGKLFNLALEIQNVIPIKLDNHSKAAHGYCHFHTCHPKVQYAHPPILNKQLNSFDAFKQIVWECIHHLQGNQDIVLQHADAEGVHQMRVAIRRLRSAFAVFKVIISDKEVVSILAELKWLANILGKARDLDVLMLETIPNISTYSNHAEIIKNLHDSARIFHTKAYDEVHKALTSQRYERLILKLSAWLENAQWHQTTSKSKHAKIIELATNTLSKHHQQLLKSGRELSHMQPKDRHAVRIYAKKLRYTTEYFSTLFNKKKSKSFINHLSKLQDTLGMLNDINNTELLVRQLIKSQRDQNLKKSVLKIFEEWSTDNTKHQLKKIKSIWRKFSNQKPFWI